MQQFSRVCLIKDHEQKQIEFVCVYPECNLSRFLCNKCLRVGIHKHQQQDQTHILDHQDFLFNIQKKIDSHQQRLPININQLRQIIREIYNKLINLETFIDQMETGMIQVLPGQQFNQSLMKLRNDGFNQLDDRDLNELINIYQQQVQVVYRNLSEQSKSIIQNLTGIQDWCHSQQKENNGLEQKIKNAQSQLITQDELEGNLRIYASAISNDYKYIASGGSDKIVKIWDFDQNTIIKSIQLDKWINSVRFTDDSAFLYIGKYESLLQFDINNQFKEGYKKAIHSDIIMNIYCITNTIILTASFDKTIIKTDINLKQQLLVIKAHDDRIYGLDYNVNLKLIASASQDKSIKLWNENNGQLIIEKQNAHNDNCKLINQVLFINATHQLLSSNSEGNIIIWNMNIELKQLEQTQKISEADGIYNISLVLDQNYIILICDQFSKIYSIKGIYIRSIRHNVKQFLMFHTIQPQTLKAIIVQGKNTLQICKINLD